MKKILFICITLLAVNQADAQFSKAELVVNGLTCSMCSFATQKQLQTIPFIDSISTDLNYTTYLLYFKKDTDIQLEQIRQKVEDAGFSVGSLVLTGQFNGLKISNNYHYNYKNILYHFMNVSNRELNGDTRVKLIDKGFVSDKEYRSFKKSAAAYPCYETGRMEGTKVYHITLL